MAGEPDESEAGSAEAAPEPVSPSASAPLPSASGSPPDSGYTLAGVPTLDGVRERIEARFGTALGATELAQDTPEARTAAQRYEAQQKQAAEKLDEIRASMRKANE